jgi:hypothetical protein
MQTHLYQYPYHPQTLGHSLFAQEVLYMLGPVLCGGSGGAYCTHCTLSHNNIAKPIRTVHASIVMSVRDSFAHDGDYSISLLPITK